MNPEVTITQPATSPSKGFPWMWVIMPLLLLLSISASLASVYFFPDFYRQLGLLEKEATLIEEENNDEENTQETEEEVTGFIPVTYSQLQIKFDMPKHYTYTESVNGFGIHENGAGTYLDISLLNQDPEEKYPASLFRLIRFSEKMAEFPDETQLTADNEVSDGDIKELNIMGKKYPVRAFKYEDVHQPMTTDSREYSVKAIIYVAQINEYLFVKIYDTSVERTKNSDDASEVYLDYSTIPYSRVYNTSEKDLENSIKIIESLEVIE